MGPITTGLQKGLFHVKRGIKWIFYNEWRGYRNSQHMFVSSGTADFESSVSFSYKKGLFHIRGTRRILYDEEMSDVSEVLFMNIPWFGWFGKFAVFSCILNQDKNNLVTKVYSKNILRANFMSTGAPEGFYPTNQEGIPEVSRVSAYKIDLFAINCNFQE